MTSGSRQPLPYCAPSLSIIATADLNGQSSSPCAPRLPRIPRPTGLSVRPSLARQFFFLERVFLPICNT